MIEKNLVKKAAVLSDETRSMLVAAILYFCQLAKAQGGTHVVTKTQGKRKEAEMRGSRKEVLFSLKEPHKYLVKKLDTLCGITLKESNYHTVEFLFKKISSDFLLERDGKIFLRRLLATAADTHPLPWRLAEHCDRLIDGKGKTFLFLPAPEAGLSGDVLQSIITLKNTSAATVVAQPEKMAHCHY